MLAGFALASLPLLWHFMHNYQQDRVLTFLSPERDPLGTGYHIIQSKIAIGSGGLTGPKVGCRAHKLNWFLPEHATDFIFFCLGSEFGLIGALLLLSLYLFITFRGLYIASQAQDTFSPLTRQQFESDFLFSMFINVGMVSGLLPVVGIPLPLVSYGGTSMVTLFGFWGF